MEKMEYSVVSMKWTEDQKTPLNIKVLDALIKSVFCGRFSEIGLESFCE